MSNEKKAVLMIGILFSLFLCLSFVACGCKHDWDSWVILKNSTCYENGVKSHTCKICGEIKEETIQKAKHNYVLKSSTATCSVGGYNDYECSVCGNEKKEYVSKKSHDYGNGYFCVYCGKLKDSKYEKFTFNTSVFDQNSWYAKESVVLCVGSSVSEGSMYVSFSFIYYSTYSVSRSFVITIINKTKNCYEGQVMGSAVFNTSFAIKDKSLTLSTPYSSSNEYYAYVSIWSV